MEYVWTAIWTKTEVVSLMGTVCLPVFSLDLSLLKSIREVGDGDGVKIQEAAWEDTGTNKPPQTFWRRPSLSSSPSGFGPQASSLDGHSILAGHSIDKKGGLFLSLPLSGRVNAEVVQAIVDRALQLHWYVAQWAGRASHSRVAVNTYLTC